MIRLGVNVDHVATLRQARGTRYPDPIAAAAMAEQAGADQITVHLREDRRHIQDQDLWTLRKTVQTALNLELACVDEIIAVAEEVRPDVCTFVPERRGELTTEGGLDARRHAKALRKAIGRLRAKSIRVSLFIDPDPVQVAAAQQCEVEIVELHTGRYADAPHATGQQEELRRLQASTQQARDLGLVVAAGHGIHYENVRGLVKNVTGIVEYNIGHSIIARSVFVGLEQAVKEMKACMI